MKAPQALYKPEMSSRPPGWDGCDTSPLKHRKTSGTNDGGCDVDREDGMTSDCHLVCVEPIDEQSPVADLQLENRAQVACVAAGQAHEAMHTFQRVGSREG